MSLFLEKIKKCTSTLVAPTVANRPISAGPSTVPLKSITLPEINRQIKEFVKKNFKSVSAQPKLYFSLESSSIWNSR